MYQIHPLGEKDLHHYATFLRDIQTQHWSLSSNAFQRQPNSERLPSCEEIIERLEQLRALGHLFTQAKSPHHFIHESNPEEI